MQPEPSQAMRPPIATRRTLLGGFLLLAFALGSRASVQVQPPVSRLAERPPVSTPGDGDPCVYLVRRWWCPGAPTTRLLRVVLLP
jgi:hypothetical protein